ncbi:MAG TPA: hypothetical protein VG186_13990 [Solirubrobacteraceae bacterium]|nr:hypothetical protein [Solirubrobacteraceae bacterium]
MASLVALLGMEVGVPRSAVEVGQPNDTSQAAIGPDLRRRLRSPSAWSIAWKAIRFTRDRGLQQALLSRGAHKTERAREKIVPIATELVARAQQAGSLRADLDPLDLPLIDLMVSAVAEMAREVSPELWERALTIIIDGLATTRQTPTPLPGKALDRDQLAAAAFPFKHGRP